MEYPIRTLQQLRPLLVGFRKRAGLSQAEVAAMLGVSQQSYAKMEANPTAASVERLFTVLRLLGSEIVLAQRGEPALAAPSASADGVRAAGLPTPSARSQKAKAVAPPKVTPPSNKTEDW